MRWLVAIGPAIVVAAIWLRDQPREGHSHRSARAIDDPGLGDHALGGVGRAGRMGVLGPWRVRTRAGQSDHGALAASPILPAALATAFVIAAPLVTRSLSPLYVGRRLLPIALPLACVLVAAAVQHMWRRGERWRVGLIAAGLLIAGVQLRAGQPIAPGRDLSGARLLIDRLGGVRRPRRSLRFSLVVVGRGLRASRRGRLGARRPRRRRGRLHRTRISIGSPRRFTLNCAMGDVSTGSRQRRRQRSSGSRPNRSVKSP